MRCALSEPLTYCSTASIKDYALMIYKRVGGSFDDYSAFVQDDVRRVEMLRIIDETLTHLTREVPPEALEGLIQYTFRLAQWAAHGLNVFDVTTSLAAGLLLTTPTDDVGFPNLPFPAFHVRIPDGMIPIQVVDKVMVERWINRIIVNQFAAYGTGNHLRTVTQFLIGSNLGEFQDMSCVIENDDFDSPASFCREIIQSFDESGPEAEPSTDFFGAVPIIERGDAIAQQLCFLLLANLCMWLESIGGLKGRKPDNSPRRPREDNEAHIAQWIVGREVKLESELIRSAKDHILGLDPRKRPSSWALSKRHTVRGHPRWQACGPKFSLRERIWIPPYWKGPKGGDVAAHIYKLRTSKDRK